MINLDHTNFAESAPNIGDVLVIMTKKSGEKKIMCQVKEIVNGNEVVLLKSKNAFFNWDMYKSGGSWVWRVWNLGRIQLTTSSNSMDSFSDF